MRTSNCGKYSIVDMAVYPWLRGWKWSKVDLTGERTEGLRPLPHVLAWIDRVRARPGVEAGLRWGMAEDEIDTWSQQRRESYLKGGGKMAKAHGASKL